MLVATSGYTSRPFRWLQTRIAPVGSFIIVTEPLGKEVCDQLMPTRRMASDSKNLLYYFRITPDHRMLFGGRARFAMSSPESDEKSGRILQKAMASVFPQLANARVDYCWGGLVDMSMDRMVHAGEHDGLYYSVGYSGHGVQMATYMGKQMAEYLNGAAGRQPLARPELQADPGTLRAALVPAVRRRLLQVPGPHQVVLGSRSTRIPLGETDGAVPDPPDLDAAGDPVHRLRAGVPDPVRRRGRPRPQDPAGPAERPGARPGSGRGADQGARARPPAVRAVLRLAAARCSAAGSATPSPAVPRSRSS